MQAETVHQNRQHNRGHRAARCGHMGVGDVFVTRDHMMQIDHVTLGHGQQPTEQIDFRGPAVAPQGYPPPGAQRRKGKGAEQQDRKKGV